MYNPAITDKEATLAYRDDFTGFAMALKVSISSESARSAPHGRQNPIDVIYVSRQERLMRGARYDLIFRPHYMVSQLQFSGPGSV
jgi:hypothetical protein